MTALFVEEQVAIVDYEGLGEIMIALFTVA